MQLQGKKTEVTTSVTFSPFLLFEQMFNLLTLGAGVRLPQESAYALFSFPKLLPNIKPWHGKDGG